MRMLHGGGRSLSLDLFDALVTLRSTLLRQEVASLINPQNVRFCVCASAGCICSHHTLLAMRPDTFWPK